MGDTDIRALVADTGRILLEKGLVARTWGNISCRQDEKSFAISPSGLGYENMTAEDVPVYNFETDTYEGPRKPSSEKKIHAAAYRLYPDVNFVIHTHQDYATAVGIVGAVNLEMTDEEKELLGNIEVAGYGLPGTGKLKKNVEAAYQKNAKVVLMIHHGAVILGKDRDDAIRKAEVLEEVCKRTVDKKLAGESIKASEGSRATEGLSVDVAELGENTIFVADDNIVFAADNGGIAAQLDDIAQMTGTKIKTVPDNKEKIKAALNKNKAVLVKKAGCVIKAGDPDDVKALEIMVKKAAMAYRYSKVCNVNRKLSVFDCLLMKAVYSMKYSKQKKG